MGRGAGSRLGVEDLSISMKFKSTGVVLESQDTYLGHK